MTRRKPVPPAVSRRMRTEQAVAATGLSRRTLYRLAEDGLIHRWKVGGCTFWSLDELDAVARPVRGGEVA